MDHDDDRSLSLGTEVSVSVPPPSPLTGCYLLAVIGEPHTEEHKEIILQRLVKGLQSWDSTEHQVDLEKELMTLAAQAPEGEDARNGERLIQFASENLVTEILIHPQMNTLMQCMRNLLSSFTRHRHLIHAGYTAAGNGSWIVQDGTFSLADFTDAYQENEVQRVIRAYENSISIDIHCSTMGGGEWANLPGISFVKYCKLRVNPKDILDSGSQAIKDFIGYLNPYIIPASLEQLLVSSDVVGNIRFSHPTLYVFPGGQGDAALFGINGFNMLVDGGFSRKACWWDFARHLDRLDAVMLTRINNSSIAGMAAVLRRKAGASVYPHIGHFFCNLEERRVLSSPDGDKDSDPLLVSLLQEGSDMMADVRHINLKPQHCWRSPDPINLYHKVGHGTLDMYVLNPSKDSKHVRDFLKKWHSSEQKLFEGPSVSGPFNFPIPNIVSICALLVWRPANPDENVTRLMFPGSTPQHKIFEGLEKLKHLEFLQHPKCTGRQITTTPSPVPAAVHTTVKRSTTKTTKEKLSTTEKKDEKTEKESVIKTGKDRITSDKKSEKIIDSNKTEKSKDETDSMNYIDNKLINELIDGEDKKIESVLREAITSRVETKLDSTSMESITKKQEFKKKDKIITEKKIKRTEKTEDNKEATLKSEAKKAEYENKSKTDARKKIDTKVTSTIARTKLTQKTSQKVSEKKTVTTTGDKKPVLDKSPPATPKKSTEIKTTKEPTPPASARLKTKVRKLSPGSTPAKSTKEANNRRVVESKYKQASPKRELTTKPTEKKETKVKREPISRRPRPLGSPVKAVKLMKSPTKAAKSIRIDPKLKGLQRVNYEDLLKDAKKSDEENSKSIEDFKQDIDDKEEQEIVREIEAVFNRDSEADEKVEYVGRSDIEKITCLITDAKTETTADTEFEEEYLIIEKEEIDQYTEESARDHEPQEQEDELQKHAKDSKESEKKKNATEIASQMINEEEVMSVDAKHAESKEHSLSVEEKQDLSSEKKTSDSKNGQAKTKSVLPETQQDEKVSSQITVESGATTTAPTLPEDERLTLDDIKESNQVEEKYDNEETKEVIPPQSLANIPKARKVRDIVKTPDEVADLPLHEEVDYQTFEEKKTPLDENKILPEESIEKPIEMKDDDVFKRIPDVGFVHEIKVPKNLPLSDPTALTDVQPIEDDVIVTTLQKPSHAEVVTVTPGSAPESPMYPENKEIKDMLVGKPLDTVKEYEGSDYCYGFTEKLRETHITTVESPLKENVNIVEEISCLPDKIPSIPEDVEKEMEEAKLFDGEKSPKSPKEVEKIVASVAEVLKSDKPLEELITPKSGLLNLPTDTIIISEPETTDDIEKNDSQTVMDLPTDLQSSLDVKDTSSARSATPDEGSDGTEKTVLSEAKKQLEIKQEINDEEIKAISTNVEFSEDYRPSDLPEDEITPISKLEAESPKTSERKLSNTFETAKTLEKLEEKMAELRKKDEDKHDTESEIVIVSEDEIKDLDLTGEEISQIMPYKVKKKDSIDIDTMASKASEQVTDEKTELVENVVSKPDRIVEDSLNVQSLEVETDVDNEVQNKIADIDIAKQKNLEESGKLICDGSNAEAQDKDKDVVDHTIIETKLDQPPIGSPITDTAKVELAENRQKLTNIFDEIETSQHELEATAIKISDQGSQDTSKAGSPTIKDTGDTLKSSVQIENIEISVGHSESLKSASPTVEECKDVHTEHVEISKDILADSQELKLTEIASALDGTEENALEVSSNNMTAASENVDTEKEEVESTKAASATSKDKEYLTDGSDTTPNKETSIRKDSIKVVSNIKTPCESKESSRSVSPAEDKIIKLVQDETSIVSESQKTSRAGSPKAEIVTTSVKDNVDLKELTSADEKQTNETIITDNCPQEDIIAKIDSTQAETGAKAICEERLKDSSQSLSTSTKGDNFNETSIDESSSTKQSPESEKISQEVLVEKESKVLSAEQHELAILSESKEEPKSVSSPIANIDEFIPMTGHLNETASGHISPKVDTCVRKDSLHVTSEDKATADDGSKDSSRSVSPAIKEESVEKSLQDKLTTTEQSTKSSRASSLTIVKGGVKEESEIITKEENFKAEDEDVQSLLKKDLIEPASPINKDLPIANTVGQHDISLGSEVSVLTEEFSRKESLHLTSEVESMRESGSKSTSHEKLPSTENLQELLAKGESDTEPIEKTLEVKKYETSKVAEESQISASPEKNDSISSEITESLIIAEHIDGNLISKAALEDINADDRDATTNLPESKKSSRSTSPKVEETIEHTEKSISDLSPKLEQIAKKDISQVATEVESTHEVESKDITLKEETVIRKDSLQVVAEDKASADGSSKGSSRSVSPTIKVESMEILPQNELATTEQSQKPSRAVSPKTEDTILKDLDKITVSGESLKVEGEADHSEITITDKSTIEKPSSDKESSSRKDSLHATENIDIDLTQESKDSSRAVSPAINKDSLEKPLQDKLATPEQSQKLSKAGSPVFEETIIKEDTNLPAREESIKGDVKGEPASKEPNQTASSITEDLLLTTSHIAESTVVKAVLDISSTQEGHEIETSLRKDSLHVASDEDTRGGGSKDSSRSVSPATRKEIIEKPSLDEFITSIDKISQEFTVEKESKVFSGDLQHELVIMSESEEACKSPTQIKEASPNVVTEESVAMTEHRHETASSDISPKVETFVRKDSLQVVTDDKATADGASKDSSRSVSPAIKEESIMQPPQDNFVTTEQSRKSSRTGSPTTEEIKCEDVIIKEVVQNDKKDTLSLETDSKELSKSVSSVEERSPSAKMIESPIKTDVIDDNVTTEGICEASVEITVTEKVITDTSLAQGSKDSSRSVSPTVQKKESVLAKPTTPEQSQISNQNESLFTKEAVDKEVYEITVPEEKVELAAEKVSDSQTAETVTIEEHDDVTSSSKLSSEKESARKDSLHVTSDKKVAHDDLSKDSSRSVSPVEESHEKSLQKKPTSKEHSPKTSRSGSVTSKDTSEKENLQMNIQDMITGMENDELTKSASPVKDASPSTHPDSSHAEVLAINLATKEASQGISITRKDSLQVSLDIDKTYAQESKDSSRSVSPAIQNDAIDESLQEHPTTLEQSQKSSRAESPATKEKDTHKASTDDATALKSDTADASDKLSDTNDIETLSPMKVTSLTTQIPESIQIEKHHDDTVSSTYSSKIEPSARKDSLQVVTEVEGAHVSESKDSSRSASPAIKEVSKEESSEDKILAEDQLQKSSKASSLTTEDIIDKEINGDREESLIVDSEVGTACQEEEMLDDSIIMETPDKKSSLQQDRIIETHDADEFVSQRLDGTIQKISPVFPEEILEKPHQDKLATPEQSQISSKAASTTPDETSTDGDGELSTRKEILEDKNQLAIITDSKKLSKTESSTKESSHILHDKDSPSIKIHHDEDSFARKDSIQTASDVGLIRDGQSKDSSRSVSPTIKEGGVAISSLDKPVKEESAATSITGSPTTKEIICGALSDTNVIKEIIPSDIEDIQTIEAGSEEFNKSSSPAKETSPSPNLTESSIKTEFHDDILLTEIDGTSQDIIKEKKDSPHVTDDTDENLALSPIVQKDIIEEPHTLDTLEQSQKSSTADSPNTPETAMREECKISDKKESIKSDSEIVLDALIEQTADSAKTEQYHSEVADNEISTKTESTMRKDKEVAADVDGKPKDSIQSVSAEIVEEVKEKSYQDDPASKEQSREEIAEQLNNTTGVKESLEVVIQDELNITTSLIKSEIHDEISTINEAISETITARKDSLRVTTDTDEPHSQESKDSLSPEISKDTNQEDKPVSLKLSQKSSRAGSPSDKETVSEEVSEVTARKESLNTYAMDAADSLKAHIAETVSVQQNLDVTVGGLKSELISRKDSLPVGIDVDTTWDGKSKDSLVIPEIEEESKEKTLHDQPTTKKIIDDDDTPMAKEILPGDIIDTSLIEKETPKSPSLTKETVPNLQHTEMAVKIESHGEIITKELSTSEVSPDKTTLVRKDSLQVTTDADNTCTPEPKDSSRSASPAVQTEIKNEPLQEKTTTTEQSQKPSRAGSPTSTESDIKEVSKVSARKESLESEAGKAIITKSKESSKSPSPEKEGSPMTESVTTIEHHVETVSSEGSTKVESTGTIESIQDTTDVEVTHDSTSKGSSMSVSPANIDLGKPHSPEASRTSSTPTKTIDDEDIKTDSMESRKSSSPLKETSPSLEPKESVFDTELHGKISTDESSVSKVSPDEKKTVRKDSLHVATDAEISGAQESKDSSRSVSPAVQTETKEEHFHTKMGTPEQSQKTSIDGSPTSKESGIQEINAMTDRKESLRSEVQDDTAIITEDTNKSSSPGKGGSPIISQMTKSVTTSEHHVETVSSEVSTNVESTSRKDSIHVPTDIEVIGDGTSRGSSRSVSPANKDITKEHSQEASRTSSPTTKELIQDTPIIDSGSQESRKSPSQLKDISSPSKPELHDKVLTDELPIFKVSPDEKTSARKDSLKVVSDAETSCAPESKDSSRSVSPAIQKDTKEEPFQDKDATLEQSQKLSRSDSPKDIETVTAEVTHRDESLSADIKDETAIVIVSKDSSKSTSPTKLDIQVPHIVASDIITGHHDEIASDDISPKTELTVRKDSMQGWTENEATPPGVSKDPNYSVSSALAEKDKEISPISIEAPLIRSEFQVEALNIGSQVQPQITITRKDSLQANIDIVESRGRESKDSSGSVSPAIQKESIDSNLTTSDQSQKSIGDGSPTTNETVVKESFESDETAITTTFEKTSKPSSPSKEITSIPEVTKSTTMKEDQDGSSDLDIESTPKKESSQVAAEAEAVLDSGAKDTSRSVSPVIIEEEKEKSPQDKTAIDEHLPTATSPSTKDLIVEVSVSSVTKETLQAHAEDAIITETSTEESIKSARQVKEGSLSPKHPESPSQTDSDEKVSIDDLSISKDIPDKDTSVRKSSLKVATDITCDQGSKDSSRSASPQIQKERIEECPSSPKNGESIIKDLNEIIASEQSSIADNINVTADLTDSKESDSIIREGSPILDSVESKAVTDNHDGFHTSDVMVKIETSVRKESLQQVSETVALGDGGLKDSSQTVSPSINETGFEESPLDKPTETAQSQKSSRASSLVTDEFITEESGQLQVNVNEISTTTTVLKDSSSSPLHTTSIVTKYLDEVSSEESSIHKSVTNSVGEMSVESKITQETEILTVSLTKDQDVDDTKTRGLLLTGKTEVISVNSPDEKLATTFETFGKDTGSSISTSAVKHTEQDNRKSYEQTITEKRLSPVSIETFDTSFDEGLTSPPLADDNDGISTKINNLTKSFITEVKPEFVGDREKSPKADESIDDSIKIDRISTSQNIESEFKPVTTKEVVDSLVSEVAEKGLQSEKSVTTKESCQIDIDIVTKDETDTPNETNVDQNQPHHETGDAEQTRDISPPESKILSSETVEVSEKPLEDILSIKADGEIQLPMLDKEKPDFVSQSIDTVDHKSISVVVASSETKITKDSQMKKLDQSSEKIEISNIASEFTDHIENKTHSSYGEASHKYDTESSTKESTHPKVSAEEDSDIIKQEAGSKFDVACVSQDKIETTQKSAEDMFETKEIEITTAKTTLDHGLVEPTTVYFKSSKLDDKIPSIITEENKEADLSKEVVFEKSSMITDQFQAKTEQSLKMSDERIKREALIIDDDVCDIEGQGNIAKPTQMQTISSDLVKPDDKTIKSEVKPSNGHVPVELDTTHVCKEDKIDDLCEEKNIESSSYTMVSDMIKESGQLISECLSDDLQISPSVLPANTQSGHEKEDLMSDEKKVDIQTSDQAIEFGKKAANGHVQHEESEQNESISYISMQSDLDSYDSITLHEHDVASTLKDEQLDTLPLTSELSHKVYSEETDLMQKSFVSIFESTLKEDPDTLASSSEDISKETSCEEKHSFECLEKESKKHSQIHDVFTASAMKTEIDSSHRESICTRTAHTETGSPKDISLSMTTDSGIMSLQADNKVGPFEGPDYTQTLKDNAMHLMESVSKAFTEDSVQQGIKTECVDSLVVRSEFERVSTPPTVPVSPLPKTPSSTQEVTDGIQSELTYDRSEGAEETITKVVHVGDDILTQKISTSTEKAAKPVKVATETDDGDLSSLMHSMGKMKTETDTVTKIIKEGVNVVTQTITTVTTKEIISRDDGTPQNVKTTIETTTLSKGSDGTTSTTKDTQTLLSECSSSLKSTSQMDLYAKDIKLDKEYLDTSDEKSESLSSQISEKESSLRSDSSTTRMKNEQAMPLRSEFITTVDDDSDDNIEDTVIDTDVSKKIIREGGLDIVETVITTTKKELLKFDGSKKILRITTETNITKERPDGSKDTQKNVDVRTEEINSETKLHKEEADQTITLDDKLGQSRKSSTNQVVFTMESDSNLKSADIQKSETEFDRKLSLSSVKDRVDEAKDKVVANDVPVEQVLEGFTKLEGQTVNVETQEKNVLRDGVLITQTITITTTKEILISDDESKKKLKTTIETVTESKLPNGTTEVVKDVKISIADYGIEIVGEKLEGYDCVGEPDEQTTSHTEEIIENNIKITRKTTVTTIRQEFENSISRTRKIKTVVRTVIEDEHPNGTVFTKKSEKTSIADVFLKTPQSESGELLISDAYTDLSEVVEDVSEDTDVKSETIQKENQTIIRTVTTKTKRETLSSSNATVKRIRTTIETITVDEYPNGATETTKDVKITVSETQTTSDSKLQSALAGLQSTGKIKTSVDKKHNTVVLDGEEATQTVTTKITKEELLCTDTDEVAIKTVTETITETAKKDGSIEIARDLQTQITYLPHGATLDDLTEEHLDEIEKQPILDQTPHELPLKQKIELPISKHRSPIGEAMSDTEVSTKHINENGVDIEQTITVVTTKELISPDKVKTTVETTTVNKGSDGITKTLKATKTTFSELEEKYGTGESEKSFSKTDDLRSSSAASDDLAHGFGSPPSDISSRESKATHAWGTDGSGLYYSDEDGPGSPSSTKSQIAHSPRSNLSFELEPSKTLGMETSFYKDPMSTSVYAQLPEELPQEVKTEKTITKLTHEFLTHEKLRAEENIQDMKVSDASFLKEADEHFDKAIEEHKKVSGSEVISNITAKYDLDLVQSTSHQETKSEESQIVLQDIISDAKKVTEIATSSTSKEETKTEKSEMSSKSTTITTSKDPIESWGKPLGLPSPIMPPTQSDGKSTPKKQNPMLNKNKLNQDKIKEARKSSESPSKRKPPAPVYLELTYVPHHGNSYYSAVEFFKRVRARYYVFSGTEPSKEIYNALLDAKKTWEDKDLEVTIIPTYDTDVLGYWVTENEDALEQYKIDLSPSASRCTINLQDHETSCAAYRLEF